MEGKILAYCRDCVLPLAIQTNAIVILHNDACVFSRCFSALIEAEEARSGELAFTPVNFGESSVEPLECASRTIANPYPSGSQDVRSTPNP
jgi:hypothetical protein